MAHATGPGIRETTTTAGTGTVDLDGAVSGYQAAADWIATGRTVLYALWDDNDVEEGEGTFTSGSPNTLSRDQVLRSSNGGALVNWGAGTRNVAIGIPSKVTESLFDPAAGNGILVRTAKNVYASRQVTKTGASFVTLTNGDGVAGNPTFDFSGLDPRFLANLRDYHIQRSSDTVMLLTPRLASGVRIGVDGVLIEAASLSFDMASHLVPSEAASTWYYFYVDRAGDPHIDSVAPNKIGSGDPVGYHPSHDTLGTDAWLCLFAWYNNGSSNLALGTSSGDGRFRLQNETTLGAVLTWSPVSANTWTSVNLAGRVPETATHVIVAVSARSSGLSYFGPSSLSGALTSANRTVWRLTPLSTSGNQMLAFHEIPVANPAAPAIAAARTGTVNDNELVVVGWKEAA